MRKIRLCGGFTLVELMAVALLVALMAGMGFVSYAQSYKKWAVEQNGREFYLAAKYARLHAIENQQVCQLVIDKDQKRYFLATEGDDVTDVEMAGPEMVKNPLSQPRTLADHVEFERIQKIAVGYGDTAENVIEFLPNGTAEHVRVQIGNGQIRYTVAISGATGRAQIIEGEIDDVQSDQIDLDLE
ncbi:MAG: pilus assembly FimT family protein [Planctomycetota bacterium]|jgi:Tfp pilus assembly protein FimT